MRIQNKIFIFLFFLIFYGSASASIKGISAFHNAEGTQCLATWHPCAEGGINTHDYYCACSLWPREASMLGYGAGQKFEKSADGNDAGYTTSAFDNLYVPATGQYRARMHLCTAGWGTPCKIANESFYYDTSEALTIKADSVIGSQNLVYTGFVGSTLNSRAMACITLVDQNGVEWGTNGGIACSDANPLPREPATCYLNYNHDLSVSMGTLERSKIAAMPSGDASEIIKKNIPIYCTRESGITVSTSFQFTPLIISGSEVISTSLDHLGVAIFYNGTLVGPSSEAIKNNFSYGLSNIELGFQAVRDPDIAIKDIPTGDFAASAIMIVTEQ
ncbi:fimbrial protein [Enterobacter quasiroggenkampii]|uniref:fimbrial protein n=1 Tax=Enterobacter quasiroggenkampii TaxID=2497436 RepID=UPI0021CE5AC6|nr:fimbrial protein [Enterobacter quasiroggenkampii]MCU6278387.1 fimbrial protein [Enterobacter quasiroggenkampii]